MATKKAKTKQISQAEKLKAMLESMGIQSAKDLDKALADALDGLTIGIMTDPLIRGST